jgi:hypothetical protein
MEDLPTLRAPETQAGAKRVIADRDPSAAIGQAHLDCSVQVMLSAE